MIQVHPQYVIDEFNNKKSVLLTLDEWKTIIESLEELEDIQLYDKAKAGSQEKISFEQAVREIEEGYDY